MLNEVERKIIKGKQRLALIGRTEAVSFSLEDYKYKNYNSMFCI